MKCSWQKMDSGPCRKASVNFYLWPDEEGVDRRLDGRCEQHAYCLRDHRGLTSISADEALCAEVLES